MRRRLSILPILIAGCGGSPAGSDCSFSPSHDYSGQYAATFTPANGSTGAREFRLSLAFDGGIGGYVRDPAVSDGSFETEVSGRLGDSRAGCGDGKTTIALTYTLPGGATESLTARREISSSIARSFGATLTMSDVTTSGTLVVERVNVAAR